MLNKRSIVIGSCILIPVIAWLFAQTAEISSHGRIPFFDPDVLLYVRWLEQSILAGKTISFDSYSCFPIGYEIRVPPLLMWLMTNAILVCHALFPIEGVVQPEWFPGIFPPMAYAILISTAFAISGWKTRSLVLSAFVVLGAFPGIAASHCFDALRLDHHFLEAFFLWMFVFAGWMFIDTGKEIFILLGGGMASCLLLSSLSAPLYFFIFCILSVSFWVFSWSYADRLLEFGKSSMLIAGGLGICYLMRYSPTGSWKNFNEFQWLQPLCIVTGGCFHMFLQRLSGCSRNTRVLLGTLVVCGTLIFFQGGMRDIPFIRDTLSLLFNKNRLMATISELQPIAPFEGSEAHIRFQHGWYVWFGCVMLFFPLLFRNSFGLWSGGGRFGLIALLTILALGAGQRRWLRLLGPGQALLAGSILAELYRNLRWKTLSQTRENGRDPLALVAVGGVIMVQFGISWYASGHWEFPDKPVLEAAEWLERNSPTTSGYSDEKKPEYGVLSRWDLGNAIAYYARRPVVANNMQLGIARLADVFTANSEREAFEACKKYGVGYLFLTDLSGRAKTINILNEYKMRANRVGQSEYIDLGWQDDAIKTSSTIEYEQSFYFWAYEMMSLFSTKTFAEGPSNFRLVYSAKNDWANPVPPVLIYKVVDGALLKGRASPGTNVMITLDCRVAMAPVRYRKFIRTGSDGIFETRLAYSTGYRIGRIETGDSYYVQMTVGNEREEHRIRVTESDVDAGATVRIH